MTLEERAKKMGEFIAEEIIKPLAPKPLAETREERIKRECAPIVGGPGKPTVNAFAETYDRQAEMRVRALRRRQKEVFDTRYECQAVRFDELTRNGTMYMRETKRKNSKRKYEPFIIGCDLAQGESVAGRIEYRKRQEGRTG